MRRVGLVLPFLAWLGSAQALSAQWRVGGELGASHLKQSGLPESNALTFGATFDFDGDRYAIRSSTLGARTPDDRVTGQSVLVAGVATPTWRSWALQANGTLTAFAQTNLRPTTSRDIVAQARFGNGVAGFAVGGGLGTTSHNAVAIGERRGLLDAWLALGAERFTAEAALTRTPAVFGESSIFVDLSTRPVNYTDLGGAWRHEGRSWSVTYSGGARGKKLAFSRYDAWQSLDGEAWLTSHVGVAASLGHTIEELVRGVPRAQYATIAMRISAQPHLHVLSGRSTIGPRVSTFTDGTGARHVEVRVASASTVELMADFTDWSPVALERDGDRWIFKSSIAPGPHRVALRVDGGEWIAPPNLPRVNDDLGGAVGFLTIP